MKQKKRQNKPKKEKQKTKQNEAYQKTHWKKKQKYQERPNTIYFKSHSPHPLLGLLCVILTRGTALHFFFFFESVSFVNDRQHSQRKRQRSASTA